MPYPGMKDGARAWPKATHNGKVIVFGSARSRPGIQRHCVHCQLLWLLRLRFASFLDVPLPAQGRGLLNYGSQ